MESLLTGIGGKLTDRWVSLLALPGVAFTLTLFAACWLHPVGAADALDPAVISRRLDMLFRGWLHSGTHRLILFVVGGLATAASALVVGELGRAIGLLWIGRRPWMVRLMRPVITRRRRRADAAAAKDGYQVRDRYLPTRATRIGDSFRLVQERVQVQYGVPLGLLWPWLWQLCDESDRVPTRKAWDGYTGAAVRVAWALGYLLISWLWWPTALVGVFLTVTASLAARRAAADFAMAAEALVDLKIKALAEALGLALPHGRFTRADGPGLQSILDKGRLVRLTSQR
ncbi:hypothetical protein GCM10029978_042740 [Actinoallomurus acanthiterrae]